MLWISKWDLAPAVSSAHYDFILFVSYFFLSTLTCIPIPSVDIDCTIFVFFFKVCNEKQSFFRYDVLAPIVHTDISIIT